ncbi:MAG: hypothetical protein WKF84_25715 [Pyrinomonadaceae bacterium]
MSKAKKAAPEPFVLPQWAIEDWLFARYSKSFFERFGICDSTGVENIPPLTDGGLIIAANHQTHHRSLLDLDAD